MISLIILVAVIIGLPETKGPDTSVSMKARNIWQEYSIVLYDPSFIKYSLCGGIGYAGMFAYIAGSPFVFMEAFELSSAQYAWAFAFNASGLILGSQLNRIALSKFQTENVLRWSSLGLFAVGCVLLITMAMGFAEVISTLILTFLFLLCLGFLNPNAQALALRPLTKTAGRGSAILGSIQMTAAALASWAVSFFANGTMIIMPMVMLICALLTLGLAFAPGTTSDHVVYDGEK